MNPITFFFFIIYKSNTNEDIEVKLYKNSNFKMQLLQSKNLSNSDYSHYNFSSVQISHMASLVSTVNIMYIWQHQQLYYF